MAVLTRTYDPAEGPILNVRISPSGEESWTTFPMLLDSGADGTSIAQGAIAHLSLLPLGRRPVVIASGNRRSVNTFLVDIEMDFGEGGTHIFSFKL